jgi:hypothetical protein
MAQWTIQRRATGGDPWVDTGEIYDDENHPYQGENGVNYSIADYISFIQTRDGWLYQGVAV